MLPNITVAPDVKPEPVMVTDVPPLVLPDVGDMDAMVGGDANVNWSADEVALVPYAVVTVTLTVPADSAGDMAVIEVDEFIVISSAPVDPKATSKTSEKLVPEMVTDVPPAVAPEVGDMDVMVGGRTNVNWSADEVALVPYVVVTVTLTVPADSAGDMAVMESGEFTVTAVAVTLPK